MPTTQSILPMQLQIGDRLIDEEGEWEVVSRPWVARAQGEVNEHARLWHPWLRIERLTRLAVAARLREPNDEADHALAAVLVQRRLVERAGWFN